MGEGTIFPAKTRRSLSGVEFRVPFYLSCRAEKLSDVCNKGLEEELYGSARYQAGAENFKTYQAEPELRDYAGGKSQP